MPDTHAIEMIDTKARRPQRAVRLGIGFVLLMVIVSWAGFLDAPSNDYVDSAIVRSSLAYAAARGLNGVVSVLQSTTFSVSMLGGVSVTGGEILDPVNDLIEQYATLMKFSIGSLVIQKVLLEIVSHVFFKALTTVSGLLVIGSLLTTGRPGLVLAVRTFLFILFLRFMLVVVVMLNSVVSHYFIAAKTDSDVQNLDGISTSLDEGVVASAEQQALRATAATALRELAERSELTNAAMSDLEAQLAKPEHALQAAEVAQAQITASLGLIERYTSQNPQLAEAELESDRLRAERGTLLATQDALAAELDDMAQQVRINENIVAGQANTFLESVQGQWRNLTSITDIYNIKDRLEASATHIISVMSLFLFETMLLPLFFLFVLSKGLVRKWDLSPLLQRIEYK